MNASTPNQPAWFSVLVYIFVALVPALWFYKQPAKLVAFLLIQAGIVVFLVTYPFIGAVIPPLLASAKSRGFLGYSNCLGGTPPIAECGRTLL